MQTANWLELPVGLGATRWVTRGSCKQVLVAVHTVASGQRLLDVVRLIESDLRIQVIYANPPDAFRNGVAELLGSIGALVMPWEQAVQLEFDLAISAAYGSVHELHAPLVVLPHGAGYGKLVPRAVHGGPATTRSVYGLDAQRLVRDGRVVPSIVVLPHEADRDVLIRQCPEALPAAAVVGDPSYDRLLSSAPRRPAYRDALGAAGGQPVIVTASTWGQQSLFGQQFSLLRRLVRELPPGAARVVALLHPNVWYGHGTRQVQAWLADCASHGLALLSPTVDWRGALAAADLVIGDYGSVAVYATALGIPVLLTGHASEETAPESAAATLAAVAPRLRGEGPLYPQLRSAIDTHDRASFEGVAARLTSEPGRFNTNMQGLLYDLLGLEPPGGPAEMPPAELSFPPDTDVLAGRCRCQARSW
jgi:hypothetical protein